MKTAVKRALINEYSKRFLRIMAGLFLYALGIDLSIKASIGLTPWDAFTVGVASVSGLTYGAVNIITGIVILGADLILKEKIGFGTLLNTMFVGVFVDLIQSAGLVPAMDSFAAGVVMLLAGQVVISVATYFYIGGAMGCGPRDALMVALGKRIDRFPIGAVRGVIEGTVLLIGYLLGAPVGIGTVIAVFGISFILNTTFRILHFEVKKVEHESVFYTVKRLRD